MTARKGGLSPPRGSKLSRDENAWFEALALREIERAPTSSWENMYALWKVLPEAWPASRRRILARCMTLARQRKTPLSTKFLEGKFNGVDGFIIHANRAFGLRVKGRPVKNEHVRRAAEDYYAQHPMASLTEIANAVSSKKNTVRNWVAKFQTDKHGGTVVPHGLARLTEHVEHFSRPSRCTIKSPQAFNDATCFLAVNPTASLAQVASAIGKSKQTLRQWIGRNDFKKLVEDRSFLVEIYLRRTRRDAPEFEIIGKAGRNQRLMNKVHRVRPKKN